jgi:hypothetical protein
VMTTATWAFTTGTTGFQDIVLPQTGLVDPTVIQFAADGKILVAEKSGRIYAFDSLADTTPALVIDLRTAVHNFWDRGMLGMALHPNYPSTPYIYVMYASGSTSTASRWEAGRFPGPFRRRPTRSRLAGNTIWSEWFAGVIDEVRVYNRALTQGEIQAGMSQTLGGG